MVGDKGRPELGRLRAIDQFKPEYGKILIHLRHQRLNSSIAYTSNGVDADFPDNCQLWLTDGYADPAAEQLPCSFCNDQNLILQMEAGDDPSL